MRARTDSQSERHIKLGGSPTSHLPRVEKDIFSFLPFVWDACVRNEPQPAPRPVLVAIPHTASLCIALCYVQIVDLHEDALSTLTSMRFVCHKNTHSPPEPSSSIVILNPLAVTQLIVRLWGEVCLELSCGLTVFAHSWTAHVFICTLDGS